MSYKAWESVEKARAKDRPKALEYIEELFTDVVELKGDRYFGDDTAIWGGIGFFNQTPVTIIAENKGLTLEENLKNNFGMPHPEGYRKVIRLVKQAEKFNRPIITFVDTPGAYPGVGAEKRGQAEAIASSILAFSQVEVPVIVFIIGEGGSGGALAIALGDRVVMLEHAIYSILSPEGFATILWKDETRAQEASEVMRLQAHSILEDGFIDHIISEPKEGIRQDFNTVIKQITQYLETNLKQLQLMKPKLLLQERYKKFRKMGVYES